MAAVGVTGLHPRALRRLKLVPRPYGVAHACMGGGGTAGGSVAPQAEAPGSRRRCPLALSWRRLHTPPSVGLSLFVKAAHHTRREITQVMLMKSKLLVAPALLASSLLLAACGEKAQESAGQAADKAADAAKESAAEVKQTAGEAAEATKEKAGEMAHATGQAVEAGAEKVQQGAEKVGDAAREAVHDAAQKVEQATEPK
mgnify:CR=1 FL=1